MTSIEVTPFNQLPQSDLQRYKHQANWMVHLPDGSKRGDWTKLEDPYYRVEITHTQLQAEGKKPFDKYNVRGWGTCVVPMRVLEDNNQAKIASFCIPTEFRPLVKDGEGNYGNIWLPNIVQGGVKSGETFADAAKRESAEEVRLPVTSVLDILLLNRSFTEPSNSEGFMELYLSLVDGKQLKNQSLDDSEQIEEKWYNWREILDLELQDSRTKGALFDVLQNVDPRLLEPEVYGRFSVGVRLELSQEESLAWYIKDARYPILKAQTIPTYHPFDQVIES